MLLGGSFTVGTFTKIETTRKLIDSVNRLLSQTASTGITASELNKVKRYLEGTFAIRMQTGRALAGELADIAFYGLPNNYLETYLPSLRSVTLSQVNRIARNYFQSGSLSMVLVCPAKAVTGQLRGMGNFEMRSVDAIGK